MQKSLTLVVGLGKSGFSIARHLKHHDFPFIVLDTRAHPPNLDEFQAIYPDVTIYLERLPVNVLPQLSAIIASPGVSLEHEIFRIAQQLECPIFNDIEWFARQVSKPIIAITGTNGKSTVTTLVGEMARCAGLKVAIAGNIGMPVLDCLDDEVEYDLWVLELSSFQLELTDSLCPVAATVLNLSPDHLDRHHTLAAYWEAKQRVYQGASFLLYNREDQQTKPTPSMINDESVLISSFGLDAPEKENWGIVADETGAYFLVHSDARLLAVEALRIKGRHNWLNALAAAALAKGAGISLSAITQALKTFEGLPHRCQWVRTLDGVDWVNDSKGTNIGATESALSGIGEAITGKVVLIAGGQGKGADFTLLRNTLAERVRSVVLMGEDAKVLEKAWQGCVDITQAATFSEAVQQAKLQAKPGDVVLLSPACASLDMFRDFNHRGEVFTTLVNAL